MAGQTEKPNRPKGAKGASGEEIHYIPNPLPLPKKHVKKEIGFDFEPAPEMLKYDIELKDGEDDFDI